MTEIHIDQLRSMVIDIDEDMRREGIPLAARSLHLASRLCRHLNSPYLYGTPAQDAAQKILDDLYPPNALAMPSTYAGAFLFKGVMYRLEMRPIFGTVSVDLDRMIVDMPQERLQQMRSDPISYGTYIDQCCDVADTGLGFGDLRERSMVAADALALLEAGFSHLQNAAMGAVANHISKDGAMHGSFLSAEMFFKGALMTSGLSEKDVRAYGHDHSALVGEFIGRFPASAGTELIKAVTLLPGSVHERYKNIGYPIDKAGLGIMAAQFIGGEIIRAVTNRNLRLGMKKDGVPHIPPRAFP